MKNSIQENQSTNPASQGIVSVNNRGGKSDNLLGKLIFVVAVIAVVIIGVVFSLNQWRAHTKQTKIENLARSENKPTAIGLHRKFDEEKPVQTSETSTKDQQIIVPAIQGQNTVNAQPIPLSNNQSSTQNQQQNSQSRYGGDVVLSSPSSTYYAAQYTLPQTGNTTMDTNPTKKLETNSLNTETKTPSQPGSLASLLTGGQTQTVQASMLGDRNMILPKGRTIACGLSMRLINEVAGMASCVLSQNVYSDNGRVLLLERGSEASGEYVAAMAQGQRRLFVLWTRIKTPKGVIINLNSPAADNLGTSGMDGYIDNHWWERVGAAFLLSMVQDTIAYKAAESSNGNGSQTYILQNTSQTGNKMAEKILDSTINIKPTLYKNQGDLGAIYVARDLDFGSVYALRAD